MSNPNDILRVDLLPFLKPVFPAGTRVEQLEQENAAYRDRLQKMQEVMDRHNAHPMLVATVARAVSPGKMLLCGNNGQAVVSVPDGVTLEVGRQVLVNIQSGQIFEALDAPVCFGNLATVREVVGDTAIIDAGPIPAAVAIAHGLELEVGARVRLDATNNVALFVLDRAAVATRSPGVSWDDIGGQHEAKEAIREAIEYPVKFADVYRAHGQKPAKGILLSGAPGCVDGDAEVTINRAGKGFRITLRDLVTRFNAPGYTFRGDQNRDGWSHADAGGRCVKCQQLWPCARQRRRDAAPGGRMYTWDPSIQTTIRCLHNGEFRLRRVTAAYVKGVKSVLKLTLGDGKTIRVTGDHEIALPSGAWARADALTSGDHVITNGQPALNEPNPSGRYLNKGYWILTSGLKNHPFARRKNRGGSEFPEHRLVAEAQANGLTLEQWRDVIARKAFTPAHVFLTSEQDVHHKDHDPTNNDPINLEIKSRFQHRREHAVEGHWHIHIPVFHPKYSEVVSVEPDGEAEVFDITVEDAHNFVANGIVVHNCGKTLLGKAVATSLSTDGSSDGFFYVKGPELLNKWIGASEAGVRDIFARARAYTAKTSNPAVLFIDEADALLSKRDGGQGLAISMSQTIVPAFLTEMDGLEESNVFVMLSTNRPEALDAAVVRDGRIDRRIHVGRPSREDAAGILRMALRGRRTADLEALVEHALKAIHNDDLTLFRLTHDGGGAVVRLSNALSGAMLKGIVAKATERAVKRDRESGELSDVSPADMDSAVLLTFSEMAKTDHSGLILECCRGHRLVRAENCFDESLARVRRSMPSQLEFRRYTNHYESTPDERTADLKFPRSRNTARLLP